MKIYVAHNSGFNFRDELYAPLRQSKLNAAHEFILPHEQSDAAAHSHEIIKQADLIIAEASYPSTGMGIELGWANSLNKPIAILYKAGQKHSSALSLIATTSADYTPETLVDVVGQIIRELS